MPYSSAVALLGRQDVDTPSDFLEGMSPSGPRGPRSSYPRNIPCSRFGSGSCAHGNPLVLLADFRQHADDELSHGGDCCHSSIFLPSVNSNGIKTIINLNFTIAFLTLIKNPSRIRRSFAKNRLLDHGLMSANINGTTGTHHQGFQICRTPLNNRIAFALVMVKTVDI